MKAIERIFQYIDYRGLNKQELERISGISNGYLAKQLSRKADIGESILKKVLENCPDISPIWLLMGEGSMLKSSIPSQSPPSPPDDTYNNVLPPPPEPATLPTVNEPHHCIFREWLEKKEEEHKKEVTSLNREIGSWQTTTKQLTREKGELKEENGKLKSANGDLNKENGELKEENVKLRAQLQATKKTNDDNNDDEADLHSELSFVVLQPPPSISELKKTAKKTPVFY